MKGSRKSAPGAFRFGVPWEWTAGIAGARLATKRRGASLCLLTGHDTHARPGELTKLLDVDLALPAARFQGYRRRRLVVRPEERGRPRETGSLDDIVTVEDVGARPSPRLMQHAKGRVPSELLFRLSIAQYKDR